MSSSLIGSKAGLPGRTGSRERFVAPATRAGALATAMVVLSGCTSMSGLGGSSSYACKAPEGVTCDSVSGTYANALRHNLPSQRQPAPRKADLPSPRAPAAPGVPRRIAQPASALLAASATQTSLANGGTADTDPVAAPLRSAPRILRLWIKPWEDADNDLHDQGYVYVRIDNGRWRVEHVQQQIRDAHAPLRPPARAIAATETEGRRDAAGGGRDASQTPGPETPAGRPNVPN